MELDRDIAVAVARARTDDRATRRGWEMLSATGVRGLRMLHEGAGFGLLVLSERDRRALRVLEANATSLRSEGAAVVRCDARRPIARRQFDYVDVDPFGSPAPFVEAAVAALTDEGLLAVTATDLPVLAGANRAACERRYGAVPLHGRLGPEGGVRILLAYLATAARRSGRRLVPRLAYVLGHHLRCYVSLTRTDPEPKDPVGALGRSEWEGPRLPSGTTFGPLWLGPLFDPEFVDRLTVPPTVAHPRELDRLLQRWKAEARVPTVLFYEPNEIAGALGLPSPPGLTRLVRALQDAGYTAARSHVRPSAFRTTAPRSVVESTARAVAQV
jgi:tRNA (guanine26-N2/guanine27-N2)-dimethyltransferase